MSNPNPQNQIQPGQVLNPTGRPKKGYSLVEIMREKMNDKDPDTKKEYREMIVNKLIKIAMRRGDMVAIKMILQYMDGMPLQKTDITSGGKPLNQLSHDTLAEIEKGYDKQIDPIPEPPTA